MGNGTTKLKVWTGEADGELVRASRDGEKGAFVEIVARHQAMVYGVAFGILNDFGESEDAAQEVFLTAWRKLAELREPNHLRAWLAQIARNAALAKGRRRRPEQPLAEGFDLTDPAPKPDEAAAAEDANALVRHTLEKLPEQYRLPLVMYYCQGEHVSAVAEALGLSEEATRQRIARGREMLRAQMEGLVESVLNRRRPNAMFTMTVAAAIGALAAPPALAATAFGSASASPITSILSGMSTTKPLAAAAVALVLMSIPIGYQLGGDGKATEAHQTARAAARVTPEPQAAASEESALFAEWRALHERYGTSAESMPVIYGAIQGLKDPLRRSAFTTALIAEWTELNPQAAAGFFSEKSRPQREREQLFREWFAANPRQALDSVPRSKEWQEIVQDSLREVAQRVPDMLVDVVQGLPRKENFYDVSIRDAFGIIAERNLESGQALALKVEGPNRQEALAGVAQVWARMDLEGAIAWAKEQGPEGDEIIRAALIGVARVDPLSALERMSSVPTGGREAHSSSTTGARVLQAAARSDFESTVGWLKSNRAGVSREDLGGLSEVVTERLIADPTGFLTRHADDGTISVLVEPIESALMNRAAGVRPVVWEWLQNQSASDSIQALRTSVLDSSAWQDPDFALELVRKLPDTPQGEADVKEVARALLNGGHELQRFEKLYATCPERLRSPLIEQAFENVSGEYMDDPHAWLERVALLPEEKRSKGIAAVAGAWATKTPEEAAQWAISLPGGEVRVGAIAKIAAAWAARDEDGAMDFLETLTPDERAAGQAAIKSGERR